MAVSRIKNTFLRRLLLVLVAIPAILYTAVMAAFWAVLELRYILKSVWRGEDL